MSKRVQVKVPDIGDFDAVDVVEVLVANGDTVEVDQGLITLESDKASMEVPATVAGKVVSVEVSVGDQVGEGALIVVLEAAEVDAESEGALAPGGRGGSEAEPESSTSPQDPGSQKDTGSQDSASQDSGSSQEESSAPEESPAQDSSTRSDADEPSLPSSRADAGSSDGADPDAVIAERLESARAPSEEDWSAYDTQLLVLGSGPGGYAAAFRAADLGMKVTLVERYRSLGGVCLNVGCIPSKALLHVAEVIEEARAFSEHGVSFGEPEIDLDQLRSWKQSVVDRLTGGLVELASRREVEVVEGTGRLVGAHALEVENAAGERRRITFSKAILAAGSRTIEIPGIPYDDERVLDSTSALELPDIPERLLVIGGGIIGLELATVYHALGSRVTVVELTDSLMPGVDPDLVRPLRRWIESRYEGVLLGTRVEGVEATDDGLEATMTGPDGTKGELFDRVLVAVGRRPNGDRIDASAAGITVGPGGFIPVDDQLRTNVAHIFAIGDLCRPPLLAHKATHEGKVAAEVAAGVVSGFDSRVIPSVAYTDPEVAWAGLTELEAKEQGIKVGKGVFPWAASGRALSLGRDSGSTKLLFDPDSGRLLGAGIVGPRAGELIAELCHAIEMGSVAEDLAMTVHPHPTLSETVSGAAEVFEGTVTDLYMPKSKKRH